MKRSASVVSILILTLAAISAWAGAWPKIEAALEKWQGPKEMVLVTDLDDPLASPVSQELLTAALEQGYAVLPVKAPPKSGTGLLLELRSSETGATTVLLRRQADGAIIGFEQRPAAKTVVPPPAAAVEPPPAVAVKPETASAAPVRRDVLPASALPAPIPLPLKPRSLALVTMSEGHTFDVALQDDAGVQRYLLRENVLEPQGAFSAGSGLRALYLDSDNLEGDGLRKMVAVWAEDVKGIYQGTESRPITRLMKPSGGGFEAVAGPEAFLRLSGGRVLLQKKGIYEPWSGPVLSLEGWKKEGKPVAWGKGDLFQVTPLNAEIGLKWSEENRLQGVDLASGKEVPGGALLHDLGEFQGVSVAAPLKVPEFRSGFSKEDVVRETWTALPPRVSVGADGTAYTVRRGRTMGLPLVSKPSGSDTLAGIGWNGRSLVLAEPFPAVEAFILDFALVEKGDQVTGALLLLNDRPDAGGRAYLQWMPKR
ncbi:MAG: hypothetical protein R2940_10695 [Syntrophotaleaceae bacterium]